MELNLVQDEQPDDDGYYNFAHIVNLLKIWLLNYNLSSEVAFGQWDVMESSKDRMMLGGSGSPNAH